MYKAADKIKIVEDQKLYKKVGKRYVQANDPDVWNGLREGWWLVKVQDGSTSIRSTLFPDNAELEAAMKDAEDKIVDILNKALQARPSKREITPEFKKAWERMIKKFGNEMCLLQYDSLYGIAENILKEVVNNKK